MSDRRTDCELRTYVDSETRNNIESLSSSLINKWSKHTGLWEPCGGYREKTTVNNGAEAHQAFVKYTDYFQTVCKNFEPKEDSVVLVPCGSEKPIGVSNSHQKKLTGLHNSKLNGFDVVVISEPCVVVPRKYRLSLPAVNYDFPPEYTVKNEYPEVFSVFTDRLAEWIDNTEYNSIYPYLISGHQEKFEVAMEKANSDPDVIRIPTASYNPDSDSYAGDMWKSQRDVTMKVNGVCAYKSQENIELPEKYAEFYRERFAGKSATTE